jgi:hypothetical protein
VFIICLCDKCSYRQPLHLRHKTGLGAVVLVHLHTRMFSFCISHFLYHNTNFYVQFNDKSLPSAVDRYIVQSVGTLPTLLVRATLVSPFPYIFIRSWNQSLILSHFKQRSCDVNVTKVLQNTLGAIITAQSWIKKYPTFPRNMSPPSKNNLRKNNSMNLLLRLFFDF